MKRHEIMNVLLESGYLESFKKKGLFYLNIDDGCFFVDMREFKELEPILFFIPNYIIHPDKEDKLIINELKKLEKQNCFCRSSLKGFCRQCNQEFYGDGEFCSDKCCENYIEAEKSICEVCGKEIYYLDEVEHHISYFPEKTVRVHRTCHGLIHFTDKYLNLKPSKEDADKFYKKIK